MGIVERCWESVYHLNRVIVFAFMLAPGPFWSRVLDHPGTVRCGFCLMDWAWHAPRCWFAVPTTLVPLLSQYIMWAGHCCSSKGLLSPPLKTRHTTKTIRQYQFTMSVFPSNTKTLDISWFYFCQPMRAVLDFSLCRSWLCLSTLWDMLPLWQVLDTGEWKWRSWEQQPMGWWPGPRVEDSTCPHLVDWFPSGLLNLTFILAEFFPSL